VAQEVGVNIHGLFLQGCRFDDESMQLAESFKKMLFAPMPCLALIPVTRPDYNPGNAYKCPLYKTTQRRGELSTTGHSTNFVLYLDLDSGLEQEHWIRRGVALLCQLDD
jgi:dynein heavy chain, axonemal